MHTSGAYDMGTLKNVGWLVQRCIVRGRNTLDRIILVLPAQWFIDCRKVRSMCFGNLYILSPLSHFVSLQYTFFMYEYDNLNV
jgi:hypothetical protein